MLEHWQYDAKEAKESAVRKGGIERSDDNNESEGAISALP